MMPDTTDNNPPMDELHRVAAFADDELDGEARQHMAEKARCCQVTAAKVRHQQQLREACQRVMAQKQAEVCPCALKERIKALCECEDECPAVSVLARIGRWAPAMIAAVLLLGVVAFYRDAFMGGGIAKNQDIARIVPVNQAAAFNDRHLTCSRSLDLLFNATKYPDSLTALPAAVSQHIQSPVPSLDLSPLGYRFAGAGDCFIPGAESVHLIYKAAPDSGHDDAVSLWMRADDDSLPLNDGVIYTRACPDTARKLLVWRRHGVVYYLLGDEPDRAEAIANDLRDHT